MRAQRLEDIARERGVWATRAETATKRISDVETRLAQAKTAHENAAGAPEAIEEKRKALLDTIADAETKRSEAGDALATAAKEAHGADKIAREADQAAGEAREARARLEAQGESAAVRVEEATLLSQETCSAPPEELLTIAEHKRGQRPAEPGRYRPQTRTL